MLFNTFPRDVGPPRQVAHNIKEFLNYVNLNNGKKTSIFTSTYMYRKVRKPNFRETPDYETVLIDKLFFDFDDKSCNAYDNCKQLHEECVKRNLKHCLVFSGRGYHLYIFTEEQKLMNKKNAILLAQQMFINSLKIIVDRQVLGNLAQMSRVPNTFNVKGRRFCIPLTKYQFLKGDAYIKELSSKQNFVKQIIGEKLLSLKPFDKKQTGDCTLDFEVNQKSMQDIQLNLKGIPPCMQNLINNSEMNYKDRFLLIIFLRDRGYFLEEVKEFLKKILTEKKFHHCIYEERQLDYLFKYQNILFPTCNQLARKGKCEKQCVQFGKVIYK